MSYQISASNSLVNGLGGTAGFGEYALTRNDDYSSSAIDITSIFPNGLNFNGQNITQLWVNNNGNLSFNSSWYTYTPPNPFNNTVIAPFWADVDTRSGAVTATPGGNSTGSNLVYYDLDTTNRVFTATWDDVGYYSYGTNRLNAFQVQLIDRGASSGTGENFDIVFRYEDINWTTGSASGGSGGLGGTVAQAGWLSAPTGGTATGGMLPGSGQQDVMLALDTSVGNYGVPGVYVFQVRNGGVTYSNGGTGNPDAGYGSDAPDLSDAYVVSSGVTYNANIDRGYDLDFYSFTPTTSGTYTFASGGSTDVIGGLFTSTANFSSMLTYDDDSGPGLNFSFQRNLTAGQTYYLAVTDFRTATGAYTFSITNGASGTAISGGADWTSAAPIQVGTSYVDSTPPALSSSALDIFSFTPTTSNYYTFASTGSLDMIGALFQAPNLLTGMMTYDNDSGTDSNFSMRSYLTAGHTYYAAASVLSGSNSGSYGFSVVQG